ncbi:uncharacterized protein N7529_009795 [Penicillium soppii]|uniref:uncharacterized protein n=1 Tax=Penicillium soppii TaxID=69789 RepID=UPI0025473321|nr:uncharacterized protein N7529_009795 [Penicillium soppii]KAJ5855851.1 hypothetical protein N7529_009795 [Penicillium soppii]
MGSFTRVMKRLGPSKNPISIAADPPIRAEAPQVNLPHVDTQLNMHQHTGLLDEAASNAQTQDPNPTSPTQPLNFSTSETNGDAPTTEWSAVGHAATGKSGRVIHNLQEEIARLTRECTLYKSRAEEYQRTNEAYKIQQQNMNERLRNLEQVNDTNLNSIARKDRKLEELRTELQSERNKRQDAEKDANQTNQTMFEERETHNREQARSQEIAKYHETQYEVLSSSNKREKADLTKRINAMWREVETLANAQKTHIHSTERLEVLADQKNREVDSLKESYEKLLAKHTQYKEMKDNDFRETIDSAKSNNSAIDKVLAQLKQTENEMKWALRLHQSREGKE